MREGQLVADRFEIDRLAGWGGMAAVYRAKDRNTGAWVAVKLLHDDQFREAERFTHEARILSELNHPAIVRYIAHGTTPSHQRYMVMEWLEGEDLAERLAGEGLTIAETVILGHRIADALGVAHARGVIHRDITPGNIFLCDGKIEQVKLLDFGIARKLQGERAFTGTGIVLGTLGYMAPEQARGQSQLDPRVDVFSLGCVLYQCLTGRPPFQSEDNLVALLAKILLENAPLAKTFRPDVPDALDDLLARMLAKDPSQRPSDGAAVAQELALLGSLDDTKRAPPSIRPVALTAREQRLVCVVVAGSEVTGNFADGTKTLSPPEADHILVSVRQAVSVYGARVERLIDGSIVATPITRGAATDQAAQAAQCALAMRVCLPNAPMALATGRALVGEAWPVGEVIDQAAQMLRADRAYRAIQRGQSQRPIRLDRVTAGLLDGRFDVGGDEVGLYLCGTKPEDPASRTLLGRLTPCVGRERELALLQGLFEECVNESVARAVLVTAPAGVGKSRLRQEFIRQVRAKRNDVEVWSGGGDAISAGSPFAVIASVLRSITGVQDGEAMSVRQTKLHSRVARNLLPPDDVRVTEFLGEVLGVSFEQNSSVQLRAARQDTVLMGDQIRRAVEDFIGAEISSSAVVLVLEDLHWGDYPSVRLLDAVLRTHAERPLMVVAFARPEVHDAFPKLWSERGTQEIRLGELSRRAAERLIRDVLVEKATDATVRKITDLAAGNAFYLEELIRATATGGELESLPETVLAMVQARLDRLEPEARRVLRAASVFGRAFWEGGTLDLLGGARMSTVFSRWFDELVEREVVVAKSDSKFSGEREFAFRHQLLRDAAYAMLTAGDLTLGHRLAGAWLEQKGERDAMALAEHFVRSDEPLRSVEHYRRAAEQALEGNDFSAAIERAERAIAIGGDMNKDSKGVLRALQAEAYKWRGDFVKAEAMARECLTLLSEGSPSWHVAFGELANASGRLGLYDQLEQLGEELAAKGPSSQPTAQEVIAWERTIVFLLHAGRYSLGEKLLDQLGPIAATIAERDPLVAARVDQARGHRALVGGDPAASLEWLSSAAEGFERAGDLRRACLQRSSLGYARAELGCYPEAEESLRDALVTAERMGLYNVIADAKHNLGLVLARRGNLEQALSMENSAVEAFCARGDRRMEGGARTYLATILLLRGEHDRALLEAQKAVDVLATTPPIQAMALATKAQTLLAFGRIDDAVSIARQAEAIVVSLGHVETGEALVRLTLAESESAAGHDQQALAAAKVAYEHLTTRASKITDPSLRRTFLEVVPENARTVLLAKKLKIIADSDG